MTIDPRFIVTLRNRDYPIFAGVLDAATKAGLRSLTTRIVQIPAPENGHLAVVMARAEFEDGRVFEDVGDCSPASTSPALAAASLRLASTRAKGRVLRDSINVGQTLLEELPDLDDDPGAHGTAPARGSGQPFYVAEPPPRSLTSTTPAAAPRSGAAAPRVAGAMEPGAGEGLPAERSRSGTAAGSEGGEPSTRPGITREATSAEAPAANGTGKMECSNAGCGKPLTKGQHDVSVRSYGQPLCPSCQKQFTRIG